VNECKGVEIAAFRQTLDIAYKGLPWPIEKKVTDGTYCHTQPLWSSCTLSHWRPSSIRQQSDHSTIYIWIKPGEPVLQYKGTTYGMR
jgi:hypothetical protein